LHFPAGIRTPHIEARSPVTSKENRGCS